MSAEVSFTKRAAAELSRCFNGLTSANRNSNNNNNNTSNPSSNSSSTASSPSHSSSRSKSGPTSGSTSLNSTNGHHNEQDTSETSLLLPHKSHTESTRTTLGNISILNTSSRSAKSSKSDSHSSPQSSSSSSSSSSSQSSSHISFHNSVQTLITKANTTLSPLTHHRESSSNVASASHVKNSTSGHHHHHHQQQQQQQQQHNVTGNSSGVSGNIVSSFLPSASASSLVCNQSSLSSVTTATCNSLSSVGIGSSPSIIAVNSPVKRSIGAIARSGIASGTPPTPPRKTSLARRKNFMLNLSKARTLEELSKDLSFLSSFFKFFSPKERTVLAQVCTYWRDLLYSDPHFWRGLIMVINCNDLRRCSPINISNGSSQSVLSDDSSVTSSTVNVTVGGSTGKTFIQQPPSINSRMNNLDSVNLSSDRASTGTFSSSSPSSASVSSRNVNNINLGQSNSSSCGINSSQTKKSSTIDAVSRSNKCTNVLNGNVHGVDNSGGANHHHQHLHSHPHVHHDQTGRHVRDSLYLSIEQRSIDSVCLIGPTDADVIDFASKVAPATMKRIKHGSLKSASVSDKGLEIFLAALNQSLISLELIGCNEITDTGLWTSLVPSLQILTIMDCINVADETVAAVAQMLPSLKEFNLQAYHVTDAAMSYFGPTTLRNNLRILHLEHCWEIGNQGVLSIAHGLPNLTAISLSGCSKITDDAIEVIAEQLRHLKSLNLSWCPRISDASLEYIACDLADSLTELNLDRCVHITDIGLGYAATMAKLSVLSLRWCPQVRDFGIQTLCSMKSLTSLALAGCPQLTVNGLSCLAQMHNLKELELTNCPAATPELIRYLYEHMPSETEIIV